MIEELREEPMFRYIGGGKREQVGIAPPTDRQMMNKINELVQRVNVLSKALVVVMKSCTIPLGDRIKIHQILDEVKLHVGRDDIEKNPENSKALYNKPR